VGSRIRRNGTASAPTGRSRSASASWREAASEENSTPGSARPRWRPIQRPTNRAIIGGLLVALAALGLYLAASAVSEKSTTNWVVARRAIPPGATITKDDLALAAGTLPPTVSDRLVIDWHEVVGKVTTRPIARDDLLTSDSVGDVPASDAAGRRVSIELPTSSALGGAISVGRRVDVVAIGEGDKPASVVAPKAAVVAVSSPAADALIDSGANTYSNRVVVTMIVSSVDEATAMLAASKRGLSLIEPAEYPA
jgi:hypothetical protein